MTKRDAIKEAIQELDSLTYDWRALPNRGELRSLLEWIYEKGQQNPKRKQHTILRPCNSPNRSFCGDFTYPCKPKCKKGFVPVTQGWFEKFLKKHSKL